MANLDEQVARIRKALAENDSRCPECSAHWDAGHEATQILAQKIDALEAAHQAAYDAGFKAGMAAAPGRCSYCGSRKFENEGGCL